MLQIIGNIKLDIVLCIDNEATVKIIKKFNQHPKMRHIDLDYCYLHDNYVAKEITLETIKSSQNLADGFTKPLGLNLFNNCRRSMGLTEYSTTEGVVKHNVSCD